MVILKGLNQNVSVVRFCFALYMCVLRLILYLWLGYTRRVFKCVHDGFKLIVRPVRLTGRWNPITNSHQLSWKSRHSKIHSTLINHWLFCDTNWSPIKKNISHEKPFVQRTSCYDQVVSSTENVFVCGCHLKLHSFRGKSRRRKKKKRKKNIYIYKIV